MVTKKHTKATTKKQIAGELTEFFERYAAILYAMRAFIVHVAAVARSSGEDPYVTTRQVAEHIAEHQPAAYLKTFGSEESKKLKVWRLKTLFYNAAFLGAYDAIGLRSVRGKGITVDETVSRRGGGLRVIKGGRA